MSETITMRSGIPAIDVKDHHLYAHDPRFTRFYSELGEDGIQRTYDEVQRDFWDLYAPEIAEEFGYGKVWAEGRSGGWLVVENPPAVQMEDLDDDETLRMLSTLNANRAEWIRFEKRIDQLMETMRDELIERLSTTIEMLDAEAAEAHEMACRDIVTV